MRRPSARLLLLGAVMALTGCSDDNVQSEYSKYRAALSLTGIETIAPLRAAIGSFGEYCTVTADLSGTYYTFSTLTNTQKVNRTAVDAYHTYRCLAGFIIGRSTTAYSARSRSGRADWPIAAAAAAPTTSTTAAS